MSRESGTQNPYLPPQSNSKRRGEGRSSRTKRVSRVAMVVLFVALFVFIVTKAAGLFTGLFHAFGEWDNLMYIATGQLCMLAFIVGLLATVVCLVCGSWVQRLIVLLPAIYFLYYLQRLLTTVFA